MTHRTWKDEAYVRVRPIYWTEVAVMSQRAGGRKTRGLKALGASSPPMSAYGLPSGLLCLQQEETQKATIQSISPRNIPQAYET